MTHTRTTTHTRTQTHTLEEEAVLLAVAVRTHNRPGRWTIDAITQHVHSNAAETKRALEAGKIEHALVDVAAWLVPVIIGQLIERGLVHRLGTSPETYVRAI